MVDWEYQLDIQQAHYPAKPAVMLWSNLFINQPMFFFPKKTFSINQPINPTLTNQSLLNPPTHLDFLFLPCPVSPPDSLSDQVFQHFPWLRVLLPDPFLLLNLAFLSLQNLLESLEAPECQECTCLCPEVERGKRRCVKKEDGKRKNFLNFLC